ncbi:hypothetical protein D6158_36280 [Nocardia seriolae]|nr:hypothetical protein C6575_36665 [Nocardia seriolae]RLP22215.1 hypothetical protein D6158_36280 [Nocardia seriolae]
MNAPPLGPPPGPGWPGRVGAAGVGGAAVVGSPGWPGGGGGGGGQEIPSIGFGMQIGCAATGLANHNAPTPPVMASSATLADHHCTPAPTALWAVIGPGWNRCRRCGVAR